MKDVAGLVKSLGFIEVWKRAGPEMCRVFSSDQVSKLSVLLNVPSKTSVSGEDVH